MFGCINTYSAYAKILKRKVQFTFIWLVCPSIKMGERSFETANLGSDLWAMGFDVELALDSHNPRKPNMGLTSVPSSSASPLGSGNIIGYSDMHQMLLHRFEDDLNEGDISQITNMTSSLPKGDSDTAQSFLAKIDCHDLSRDLGGSQGTSQKGIEATLFGAVGDGSTQSTEVLSHKSSSQPVDVCGRVSLYEGKLILQLRHFNISTNYPVHVSECWLCREKISSSSQLHNHKHILQGLFQVNNEYVQMDIDHYIIPEQALEPDPPDVNRNLNQSNIMSGSAASSLTHHVAESRTLTLVEDMECSDALQNSHVNMNPIGSGLHTPQRNIDTNHESLQTPKGITEIPYSETELSRALTSAQPPLSSSVPIDSNSFLGSFSNHEIRMPTVAPSIVQSSNQTLVRHLTDTTSDTTSFQATDMPITTCSISKNNPVSSSEEPIMSSHDASVSHSSLSEINNIQVLCTSSNSIGRNDGFIQHTSYEPNIGNKEQLDNYQNFFGSHYPYSYDNSNLNAISKFPVDSQLSSSQMYHSSSSNISESKVLIADKQEIRARKRKCRTQKRLMSYKLKGEQAVIDASALSNKSVPSTNKQNNPSDPIQLLPMEGHCSTNAEADHTVKAPSPSVNKNQQFSANVTSTTSNLPNIKDFIVECPSCKLQFSSQNIADFKSHIKIHEVDSFTSFSCRVCAKDIVGPERYIRHLKVHCGKRHFCHFCDSHYSRPDKLKRHISNIHDGDKRLSCVSCSKAFSKVDYIMVQQTSQPVCASCRSDGFIQHTTYEPNIGSKDQIHNYQSFFGSPYSYSYGSSNSHLSKFISDPQPPPPPSPPSPPPTVQTNHLSDSHLSKNNSPDSDDKTDVSAKKQKCPSLKPSDNVILKIKEEQKENSFPLTSQIEEVFIPESSLEKHLKTSSPPRQPSTVSNGTECSTSALESPAKEQMHTQDRPMPDSKTISSSADSSKQKFVVNCPTCKRQFSDLELSAYKIHMKIHLGIDSFTSFRCPVCSKTVVGPEKYIRHLKVHNSKRHYCPSCDSNYSRIDKLRRHITNVHDSKRPYVCDICSKAFSRLDYLQSHKNIHSGKKFECNTCQKLCSSQYNLDIHKKTHAYDQLPFVCDICSKAYQRKDFLAAHVAKDHKNRRFRCEICTKLFSRNDVLLRHMLVHDEKRRTYDCEECGKKFRRRDRLKAHSYDHNEVRNGEVLIRRRRRNHTKHQCHLCSKLFPSHLRLEKHLKWHQTQLNYKMKMEKQLSKSYTCEECNKFFRTNDLLKRHLTRVHDKVQEVNTSDAAEKKRKSRQFICEICSKLFTRSYSLKTHLKTHLKKIEEDDKMLDELPTVLNASRPNVGKERRKRAYFNLMKDVATKTCSAFELITSASSNSLSMVESLAKDQHPSSCATNLHIPIEEAPPTSSATSGNAQFSSLSTELAIPTSVSLCSLNLSSEAIGATAYLLAHPFYEGRYP